MVITLSSLELTSFMRAKHLLIELDGQDAILSGRNGTGKTTAYNALLWLLFGKDSEGRKPDVKPIDSEGQRIAGCDAEVKAVLNVDGKPVTLRKVLHEKWQKTAGSVEPIYVSDETLCWVDDVPMKIEKEYLPFVLNLLGGDETIFKLVTDTNAFMRLNWNDRRKELMRIVGVDCDPALTDQRFAEIPQILNGATTDDARKRLQEQKKRHNDSLKTIPARMDELERSFQHVTESEIAEAQAEIKRVEEAIASIDAELASGGEARNQMDQLLAKKRDAAAVMDRIKYDAENANRTAIQEVEVKLEATRREVKRQEIALDDKVTLIVATQNEIEYMKSQLTELRIRRRELIETQYVAATQGTTCPACGQDLPIGRVQEAAELHHHQWQETKAKQEAAITEQGLAAKAKLEQKLEQLVKCEEELASMRIGHENLTVVLAEYEKQLVEAKGTEIQYENAQYFEAKADFEAANTALEQMGTDDRVSTLNAERVALKGKMEAPNAVLDKYRLCERVMNRKEELTTEKRSVGDQLAEVERKLALLGKYVSARCAALEEIINSNFKTIRWQLFEMDKTGNVKDCCKATVGGISYESGLNSSAKTNAGIEIIRALSRAYGISVPCFVDNAETINNVADTGGQMIQLKVTEEPALTLTLMGKKEDGNYGATA